MYKPSEWTKVNDAATSIAFSAETHVRANNVDCDMRHLIDVDEGFICREEAVYHIRDSLRDLVSPAQDRGESEEFGIDLFHPGNRAPGKTVLKADFQGCHRRDCVTNLIHTLDTLVALPGVLLNPDRYLGNWWITSPEDLYTKGEVIYSPGADRDLQALTYYGVDNTILYHPALFSIFMGLFRQAIALSKEGMTEDLEKVIPREELVEAISGDNTSACLALLKKARPWIEANSKALAFPVRMGEWDCFLNLHRALYKHGFKEVFGSVEEGWGLEDAYLRYTGNHSYFNRSQVARLTRLANKAA